MRYLTIRRAMRMILTRRRVCLSRMMSSLRVIKIVMRIARHGIRGRQCELGIVKSALQLRPGTLRSRKRITALRLSRNIVNSTPLRLPKLRLKNTSKRCGRRAPNYEQKQYDYVTKLKLQSRLQLRHQALRYFYHRLQFRRLKHHRRALRERPKPCRYRAPPPNHAVVAVRSYPMYSMAQKTT